MSDYTLANLEKLKKTCVDIVEHEEYERKFLTWGSELIRFLDDIAAADVEERQTETFQRRLWDDNPVSAPGQGTISVDKAIADPEFRRWLAGESLKRLPESRERWLSR